MVAEAGGTPARIEGTTADPRRVPETGTKEGNFMLRYRLSATTLGIHQQGIQSVAISIPAGTVVGVTRGLEKNVGFVEVEWEGKCIHIFVVDLRERDELVKAMSATGRA